jgi:hypothetical protein
MAVDGMKPIPVRVPTEFGAEVYGPGCRASVTLWKEYRYPPEPDRIQIHLVWIDDRSWVEAFQWRVSRNGTRAEIIAFLEEWVPKCPDPELLNRALEQISAKIPEDWF